MLEVLLDSHLAEINSVQVSGMPTVLELTESNFEVQFVKLSPFGNLLFL